MIQMLHKYYGKWYRQGHEKVGVNKQRQEAGKPCGNTEMQCYNCRGYRHFKKKCPTTKRRRFKSIRCRKIGHDEMQKKERSFIKTYDNKSEKDKVLNLVTFGAYKNEANT